MDDDNSIALVAVIILVIWAVVVFVAVHFLAKVW
jgi:hypothetical protein